MDRTGGDLPHTKAQIQLAHWTSDGSLSNTSLCGRVFTAHTQTVGLFLAVPDVDVDVDVGVRAS